MAYATLHDRLKKDVHPALSEKLNIKNIHALPSITKVVVNVGINKSKMDGKETIEYIGETLKQITGQQPVFTKARKAISNFKVREGMVVGALVTLRGKKMHEFLDRLLSYAIPRIRDFRGLPTKLDGNGNYAIGLRDHSIFPEVPPPDAGKIFGMQIQVQTTAKNDDEALALLRAMGFPFRPEKESKEVDSTAQKSNTTHKS
jgi:large subunit ribosomal protein L5